MTGWAQITFYDDVSITFSRMMIGVFRMVRGMLKSDVIIGLKCGTCPLKIKTVKKGKLLKSDNQIPPFFFQYNIPLLKYGQAIYIKLSVLCEEN